MRAVIAGAGIGGLAVAIALRGIGIDATVLEAADALRTSGTGLWLWPNAVRALEAIGADGAVRSAAFAPQGARIRSRRGRTLASFRDLAGPRECLGVHRPDVMDALVGVLGSEHVEFGSRVTGVRQGEESVVIDVAKSHLPAHSSQREADLLVAADGLGSQVRRALFDPEPPRQAGFMGFRAVIEMAGGPRSGEQVWGHGARFGFIPLSQDRVNWFASVSGGGHSGSPRDRLLERFAGWPAPVEEAIASTAEGDIVTRPIMDVARVPPLAIGRVALLGDAAHAMTPSLGQGACLALEDAATLAHCLSRGQGVVAALADYGRRRRRRANTLVSRSRRLDRIIQVTPGPLCRVRDLILEVGWPLVFRARAEDLWRFEVDPHA